MPPITLTLYAKFEADDVVDTFLADVCALASATFVACTAVTCKHDRVQARHTVTLSCVMSAIDDECLAGLFDEYRGLVPSIVEAAIQACSDTKSFDNLAAMTRADGALVRECA